MVKGQKIRKSPAKKLNFFNQSQQDIADFISWSLKYITKFVDQSLIKSRISAITFGKKIGNFVNQSRQKIVNFVSYLWQKITNLVSQSQPKITNFVNQSQQKIENFVNWSRKKDDLLAIRLCGAKKIAIQFHTIISITDYLFCRDF